MPKNSKNGSEKSRTQGISEQLQDISENLSDIVIEQLAQAGECESGEEIKELETKAREISKARNAVEKARLLLNPEKPDVEPC